MNTGAELANVTNTNTKNANTSFQTDSVKSSNRGVYVSTYGCQMNVNDTERMYALLEMSNFTPVSSPDQASLLIINSCSVREKPVHKVYSEVGTFRKLKEKNPNIRIGVGGCVGQQEKEKLLKTSPLIDFVFGTDTIDQLTTMVAKAFEDKNRFVTANFEHRSPYHVETLVRNPGVSTFVNITKGCDNFCTFCVVPYTRGREKSRPMKHVIEDIHQLTRRGVKEVTLLGQNVNSYQSECGADLADLLKHLSQETDLQRIRFTTSHPKDFNEKLIQVMMDIQSKLCEYIHLPFQSGNSRILEMMNRGYTREQYLEKIAMIKKIIPNVVLSTDIIVGFPTETEEEFQDTMSMVEQVGFETIFAFMYSPRPFTKAARFDGQLDEKTKSDRLNRLFDMHDAMAMEIVKRYENQVLDVLVDSYNVERNGYTGRSSQNKLVHFSYNEQQVTSDGQGYTLKSGLQLTGVNMSAGGLVGKMVPVQITSAKPAVLRGELS